MEQDILIETVQFHDGASEAGKGPLHIEIQGNIDIILTEQERKKFNDLSEKLQITPNELIEGRIKYRIKYTRYFDINDFLTIDHGE